VARHDVALVLGSGWAGVADALGSVSAEVPQHELTGFPAAAVEGHGGTVRSVEAGRHRVLVFLGRTHLYEGNGVDAVVHPVRTAVAAGCSTVVLTNACGGIRADLRPGQPVLISDHISFTGVSPLRGPQFVDLSALYAPRLRRLCREIYGTLTEGVYGHWPGPAYETPAEIQMLRTLGCDLVGMSTVPEAIAAHTLGAEVLAIALVTNLAAGLGAPLRHDEVLREGKEATARLASLLVGFLARLQLRTSVDGSDTLGRRP
jgi:purine-nucleoside phosphorylase